MKSLTTCLWFAHEAEEAARFYTSVFPNSEIGRIAKYGKAGQDVHGMKEGTVMTVQFFLNGREFLALNAGPIFKFNESISLVVNCETQKEIDYYWEKLTADGGQPVACGWLKDKYGLSWQIVPTILEELMSGDQKKADRVMTAFMKMTKYDIEELKRAAEGR